MRRGFSIALRRLVDIEGYIAIALLCAAILLNAVEILQRNVLHNSFVWIQEVSTVMMLWFTMFGYCKIAHSKSDMVVTFLTDRFPKKAQKGVAILTHGIVLAFLVVVLFGAYDLFMAQKNATTLVAYLPLRIRSIPLLISFFTLILTHVEEIVDLIFGVPAAPAAPAEQAQGGNG